MDYPDQVTDRQLVYFDAFDKRIRAQLRALVTDSVIAEHKRRPLGQHSDALDRLLNYFRRGGLAGKFGLLQRDPGRGEYRIVVFPGARGAPATVEEQPVYDSLDAGYHAVFLRRIAALMAS